MENVPLWIHHDEYRSRIPERTQHAEDELLVMRESSIGIVNPTPTQRNGAVRSHNNLREVLNTGHMEKRIVTSYLSGSYARNTVIYPLDDVDIIVVIDPKAWGGGWLDPNPEAVLKSFHRAIKYRYPNSHVRMATPVRRLAAVSP